MVFRKRRSTSFSKDESKTSADVPVERSNGNRNWFDQSKRDIRKVERTKKRKEKKGKLPSSHLQSQRLIGGKDFFAVNIAVNVLHDPTTTLLAVVNANNFVRC